MLSNILMMLFLALVVRGFARTIRYFWAWLGHGGDVDVAVEREHLEEEERAAAAVKGGRLTREQIVRVAIAHDEERDEFLDKLHIGWYQIIILFTVGSIAGLFLEEVWMFISAGLTQSRVGLVWGPFSPLYGFGATFLTLLSFYMRKHHVKSWQVFLVSAAVGGTLEQFTGWAMETLFHAQSWTYLYLPDHITQWIAWRFLLMWGILGLAWAKLVMPELLYRIGKPTTKRQIIFVTLLAVYLTFDIFMTLACFQRRTDRDAGIPASTPFEQWIDTHYTDEFMSNKFQNLVIGKQL